MENELVTDEFKVGDRVSIRDCSNSVPWLSVGMLATVTKIKGNRLSVIFDLEKDRGEISGSMRRFRHALPLEEML